MMTKDGEPLINPEEATIGINMIVIREEIEGIAHQLLTDQILKISPELLLNESQSQIDQVGLVVHRNQIDQQIRCNLLTQNLIE